MVSFNYLDLDQVDGLQESGFGGKDAGVQATSGRGDDLTASSVDGVGMKGHVVDVESAGAHVLVAENALKINFIFQKFADFFEVRISLIQSYESVRPS